MLSLLEEKWSPKGVYLRAAVEKTISGAFFAHDTCERCASRRRGSVLAMATKVEVFFDVVSPYTYLFLHALAKLEGPWALALELRPVFLGGSPRGRCTADV